MARKLKHTLIVSRMPNHIDQSECSASPAKTLSSLWPTFPGTALYSNELLHVMLPKILLMILSYLRMYYLQVRNFAFLFVISLNYENSDYYRLYTDCQRRYDFTDTNRYNWGDGFENESKIGRV
ncbi:uncharacterized protein LOC123317212 [Coccinella septempunctata]|uniref:uncharacterized protein LOC123317212 n=1 Tax=Coccinella septempunctata TaxID=41139 RepID=UPI001D079ECD|nr:uncharacterized protein LOC123317212 [Coccinella septempunctata]